MIAESKLRGRSLERAEMYGKPHIGARYTGKRARDYERTDPLCFICGRKSRSCHHAVPLSCGERFELRTERGVWRLRSPLFALCGSGTTGCHDGFHGGARFVPRWVWDSPEYEDMWWEGRLLERYAPHSPELYLFGRWEIEDRASGRPVVVRGLA